MNKKEFTGWYGGLYGKSGFFNTKPDAERGFVSNSQLIKLLRGFCGKKIKITVEVIEE